MNQAQRGEQHRRQLSRVHHRNSNSSVASHHGGPARRQILRVAAQNRCRRRVRSKALRRSVSARRRLWEQGSVSSVAEVRRLGFVNRQCLRQVAEPVKRAVEEKEHRADMANRLRRRAVERVQRARQEKECRARRLSRSSAVARPVQASGARARHNQTAGGSDNQKKRQRQGRDNFYCNKTSGSGTRNTGAAFVLTQNCKASVSDAR